MTAARKIPILLLALPLLAGCGRTQGAAAPGGGPGGGPGAQTFDHTTEHALKPNLLWIFALEMNRYMTTYGIKKEDIARVSVQHKRNATNHPCALLGEADITVEDVLNSETLAWPVQRFDVSPVSDGAVAIILAPEHVAKRLTSKPLWNGRLEHLDNQGGIGILIDAAILGAVVALGG